MQRQRRAQILRIVPARVALRVQPQIIRLERKELTGYQASARGGTVRVRLDGTRVQLGGQAVTVLRCELVESEASS